MPVRIHDMYFSDKIRSGKEAHLCSTREKHHARVRREDWKMGELVKVTNCQRRNLSFSRARCRCAFLLVGFCALIGHETYRSMSSHTGTGTPLSVSCHAVVICIPILQENTAKGVNHLLSDTQIHWNVFEAVSHSGLFDQVVEFPPYTSEPASHVTASLREPKSQTPNPEPQNVLNSHLTLPSQPPMSPGVSISGGGASGSPPDTCTASSALTLPGSTPPSSSAWDGT